MKLPVQLSGLLSWRRLLRKSSTHAFKRGALGKLRTLAHSVASSKFQQLIANPTLLGLLGRFGITERAAYIKQYGEDFAKFLLDGTPLPLTAEQLAEQEANKLAENHGQVYA